MFVEARPDREAALLTVTDGCGGIPEADLPRVFDLAWRGTDARSPAPDGGAGLGLAIVRGLVEAHRGIVRGQHQPLAFRLGFGVTRARFFIRADGRNMNERRRDCICRLGYGLGARGHHRVKALSAALEQNTDKIDHHVGIAHCRRN